MWVVLRFLTMNLMCWDDRTKFYINLTDIWPFKSKELLVGVSQIDYFLTVINKNFTDAVCVHDMPEHGMSKKEPTVDFNNTWNDLRTSNLSPPTVEDQGVRSPSPNIILRSDNEFLSSHKSSRDPASDAEEEAGMHRVPDVLRDDLASRRSPRGPAAPNVHQFVPPPVCSNKDRERWEGIRRSSQKTLQEKEIRSASE